MLRLLLNARLEALISLVGFYRPALVPFRYYGIVSYELMVLGNILEPEDEKREVAAFDGVLMTGRNEGLIVCVELVLM